jgi:hypothetical protein
MTLMIFLPAVVALDDIIGSIFFIFMDYYVKMLYGCNLGVVFFFEYFDDRTCGTSIRVELRKSSLDHSHLLDRE